MRCGISRGLIGIGLLWTVSLRGQTDSVTPPSAADDTRVVGNDDLRTVNVEEGLEALLNANDKLVGSVAKKPVTAAAAIAKARALAQAAVPPASLKKTLQALPDGEAETWRLFAFALLAKGQPSAAFAVLVAAYDRAQDSADSLSDLAGMLASFGYPNEALALLDELARRGVQPSPPMGLEGRDLTDYTRGYALARLGDVAAAKPLLEGVAKRQPLLVEASRTLAIVAEDPADKRKFFVQGVWRHRASVTVATGVDLDAPEPDPLETGDEVAIDVRSVIDLSKGSRGELPLMGYAKGVPQANDLYATTGTRYDAAAQRTSQLHQQLGNPKKYHHTDTAIEDTWGYRMRTLVDTIAYRDKKLRELERRQRVADRERTAAERRINNERMDKAKAATDAYLEECLARNYRPTAEQVAEKARPAHEAALTAFMPYINRQEQAQREWFAEWHLLATAIAAQVGDDGWHEYIRISIEAQRWSTYRGLLHLVKTHAGVGMHPGITKDAGEVPTEPQPSPVNKCDGNSSIGFSTQHLPGGKALPFEVGMEMTCEGMSLEVAVDTKIPGVSISAEIGGDNTGSITAFVGPKAEVSVGPKEIVSYGASAKAGAYVTGNRNGVQEAGVKYEAKINSRIGNFTASQKVAEGKVNFIPAPNPGDGGMMSLASN